MINKGTWIKQKKIQFNSNFMNTYFQGQQRNVELKRI